jgi:1-aminocyclopropane-1-carboxylate deaminase/D-cysteine desulfhydrase-like pyridoxal-dependent ACC family enzyme
MLEFRLARTMAEQPDTVVVGLDIQSNSARQTIGACNKLGLKTILVLEGQKRAGARSADVALCGCERAAPVSMGFAALNPSYGLRRRMG